MSAKTIVAAICRACGRELRRNSQDTDQAAFTRAKWGQPMPAGKGQPMTGVCRHCRKNGKG